MKKNIFYSLVGCLLFVLLLGFTSVFAQAEEKVWILLSSEQELVSNNEGRASFRNTAYNDFLERASINTIRKVFPDSKNDTLRRLYEVQVLKEKIPILMSEERIEYIYVEEEYEDIALYDPSDYFWNTTTADSVYRWHLEKIQANFAWDITRGNPTVKIAIIDTGFEINHPDLTNQLYCTYDPVCNTPFTYEDNHGTMVASFAAAENDGDGYLASIGGFNAKIIPYRAHNVGITGYLERAHHASLVMQADVLTSSAGG